MGSVVIGNRRSGEFPAEDAIGAREQPQSTAKQYELARSPNRRAIVVLGMHRSGTSALAGVINGLGATAPKSLMSANCDNPRGYFESEALRHAHDELLASAGSRWDDWRQLDPQWLRSQAAARHRQKIEALLIEEFGDEPFIMVKDPRICRFLTFTLSVLDEMEISPAVIVAVRNPLEVAFSLRRRDDFVLSKSILLWLRHVLEAEFHSRHTPRCFVSYEQLLIDWRHCIDLVATKMGISWPQRADRSDADIDNFLTPELRRERVSHNEFINQAEVTPLVRETYDILTRMTANGEDKKSLKRLDLIRDRFNEAYEIFGPVLAAEELVSQQAHAAFISERATLTAGCHKLSNELNALVKDQMNFAAERERLTDAYQRLVADYNKLSDELNALVKDHMNLAAERERLADAYQRLATDHDAILASTSWRLTAPLRFVSRSIRSMVRHWHRSTKSLRR